jgi:hypothetical protein
MGAGWQKIDIDIPANIPKFERRVLAEELIEYIRLRTEGGDDKYEKSFKEYSPKYMDSLDFKIAGKTSKVNLKQTGDMLAAIELLSEKKGKLTIGFQRGTLENDKADGHITGNVGVTRDFLGFAGSGERQKLKSIVSKYEEDSSSKIERALLWTSSDALRTKRKKPTDFIEVDDFEDLVD